MKISTIILRGAAGLLVAGMLSGCDSGAGTTAAASVSLEPVKTLAVTAGNEGGSARPEIVATDSRVFVVYLGHIAGGASTKSFDVKVYEADLATLVTFTTIVPPSLAYGTATDIRIASEGQYVYTFYETSSSGTTYLHGAKYALNDSFDLVARAPEPIASAKPEFQAVDGDEVLNDPAPLVGPDSVFAVTRIRHSLSTSGNTVYRVREFNKDTMAQVRQFDLDLSSIADGRGRVTSLYYRNNAIYMALATTVSDQGVNDSNDDGAQCDILLVKMTTNWTFDPQADVRIISSEPDDRENYITGLRADDNFFYMTYKQAVGSPPDGEQRAVIKVFDKELNLRHEEIVRSVVWGAGGGEIRPSFEVFSSRIYSGQSMGATMGNGDAAVYLYELR